MKNIFKLSALLVAAVIAAVSCQKDEIDTAQYSDSAVTLASFGPNPAMRGGTVTFYGSNLDKVTEINVPGMSLITGSAIEVVESGKTSQIRITLDTETPEVGYITLKAADGTVLQTKSEVTYKEPIVFDSFIAKDVNYPGDVITLQGTYMDLVKAVIFEGGEEVPVEEGAIRHSAAVVIPANALTGLIILSDKAEIESLFYSKEVLVIGEPTVTPGEKATAKMGETLSFTGEHLEMIEKITMDGAEVTEFTLAEDNKSISFTLPATAKSGDYHAVSFAGKSYKAGEVDAIVPVVTSVQPSPVKAGSNLVIKGQNLDLITKVAFDGDDNATFSFADDALEIAVSNTVKEGKVQLITANESAVEAEFTLVHPAVTKVEPETIFAGDSITIVGTDLDLVIKATLGKNAESICYQTTDTIIIATAATSASGKLVLSLSNEETVTATEMINVEYHSLVIVTERPASQHIGELVTLKGKNMSLVESIFIGSEKVTKYSLRTDEELSFLMPYNKVGSYPITFVLYDGSEETQPEDIEVLLERTFDNVFEGEATVSWNNAVTIPNSRFTVGQKMVIEYKVVPMSDNYSMLRVISSDWVFNLEGNATYNKNFGEDGVWEVPVTKELMNNLAGKDMSLTGYGCAVLKVTLIGEVAQEKTIFEGPCDMSWGDTGRFGVALESFDGVVAGQKLIFYLTHTHDWGQIQINNGWWNQDGISFPEVGGAYIKTDLIAAGAERVELTLTEETLASIREKAGDYKGLNEKHASPSGKYGLVIQGQDFRIEKVTIL